MTFLLTLLGACAGEPPVAPPAAPKDPCPQIGVQGLAGDWVRVLGGRVDPSLRVRLRAEGGVWSAWLVDGAQRLALRGEPGPEGITLREPSEARLQAQVLPDHPRCAARLLRPDLEEVQLMPYPAGAAMSWRGCDEPAFWGKAARTWALASKDLAAGGPLPPPAGQPMQVAAFSDIKRDGDPSCVYSLDLYLDGLPVPSAQDLPADEVQRGQRRWAWQGAIPDGGDRLEIHRNRRCGGGPRELIAVACLPSAI